MQCLADRALVISGKGPNFSQPVLLSVLGMLIAASSPASSWIKGDRAGKLLVGAVADSNRCVPSFPCWWRQSRTGFGASKTWLQGPALLSTSAWPPLFMYCPSPAQILAWLTYYCSSDKVQSPRGPKPLLPSKAATPQP